MLIILQERSLQGFETSPPWGISMRLTLSEFPRLNKLVSLNLHENKNLRENSQLVWRVPVSVRFISVQEYSLYKNSLASSSIGQIYLCSSIGQIYLGRLPQILGSLQKFRSIDVLENGLTWYV